MATTLLHISDLHLGDVHPLTKASYSDPAAVAAANVYQFLPGNLGHCDRALAAIHRLHRRLTRQGPVEVILTGDVTAFGRDAHFGFAGDFVDRHINRANTRRRIGLNRGGKRQGIIPGNHDYFAGTPIPPGRLTGHFTNFFARPFPAVDFTVPLPSGRQIRFLEIDCDADFAQATTPRLTARASGEIHLRRLPAMLRALNPQPPADEIRVLLMHGSPTFSDGRLHLLEVMRSALAELERVCQSERIRLILTGHVHRRAVDPIVWPGGGAVTTTELRCGTSSQVLVPRWAKQFTFGQGTFFPPYHHAMVHRIDDSSGSVQWSTEEHVLNTKDTEWQSRGVAPPLIL